MSYSIVDDFIYARPNEWAYPPSDFPLFERLSDQVDDRLYAELFQIFMRPGDQTVAMLVWAALHNLSVQEGL